MLISITLRTILCALCGALLCTVALADTARFRDVAAFLASIPHANAEQSQIAKGDLNADGREDVAVVVATTTSNKDGETRAHQLFVLLQEPTGGLRVVAASQRVDQVGAGCCWVEGLEIRNQSVYIQNNAKTACSMEAATHQFKQYAGVWRLIGHKVVYLELCDGKDATKEEDSNLLTGKTIVSTRAGDKPKRTSSKQRSFPVALLTDFDFFNGFGVTAP